MKFIIIILLIVQSYSYACSLCATDIPQVSVSAQISYEKEKTSFDIKWQFHKDFVTSLTQYDLNENSIFDKDEQLLIKESLVDYIERFHYLTNIEYKPINKETESQYIQNINSTLSELEFIDDTMTYHYTFSLPFILKNKHTLYLGFRDEGDNFNFTIKSLILNNYKYAYSLENKLIYVKIKLNDPSIIEPKKNIEQKQTKIKTTQTYLEVLSKKLTSLKNDLKTTLKDIKQNNNLSSYIWLLVFSFLYGIVHAIGPGHGKSLVSSYFINQNKSYVKA
ncbi:MAG: nickel/cobalt exporter, partial [Arcobacteraceae bacterium]